VDACSSGTHSKLLDGEGSVLGRNLEELLQGVARIKVLLYASADDLTPT